MFDFTKSYSSKSNLMKALKKVFDAAAIEALVTYESEGRWFASDASEVLGTDAFEATEEELAAQADRPKHEDIHAASNELIANAIANNPELKAIVVVEKIRKPITTRIVAAPVAPAGEQNGLRYPKAGGLCWKAWQMFDEIGNVPVFDAVLEGAKRGLNDNNVRIELCRWRKYNGFAPAKKALKKDAK